MNTSRSKPTTEPTHGKTYPMNGPEDLRSIVRANLAAVRERIAAACDAAGRPSDEVRLIGVSKYVDAAATAELVKAGCRDLGESRPQQLWEKAAEETLRGARPSWRMIGHLQRNKVARTVAIVDSIDSVDSVRLLAAINRSAQEVGKTQSVLLEVNCSGDAEKHGFKPDEIEAVLDQRGEWPNVNIRGLMTMAARGGGNQVARRNFADLYELITRVRESSSAELPELSMGMSGDFEAGIAEGSTLVRVGSALWAGILRS